MSRIPSPLEELAAAVKATSTRPNAAPSVAPARPPKRPRPAWLIPVVVGVPLVAAIGVPAAYWAISHGMVGAGVFESSEARLQRQFGEFAARFVPALARELSTPTGSYAHEVHKTDSLTSPYIGTINVYCIESKMEVVLTFAFQEGRWVYRGLDFEEKQYPEAMNADLKTTDTLVKDAEVSGRVSSARVRLKLRCIEENPVGKVLREIPPP